MDANVVYRSTYVNTIMRRLITTEKDICCGWGIGKVIATRSREEPGAQPKEGGRFCHPLFMIMVRKGGLEPPQAYAHYPLNANQPNFE
jgi:hypothetical protein